MLRVALALVIAASSAAAGQGYSFADEERRRLNNFQHEVTVCANYFLLVQKCLVNTPSAQPETVQKYGKAADDMIRNGLAIGRLIGMSQDAMTSRMKMEGDAMMSLVQGDCINISSAIARHTDRCVGISNGADAIVGEILSKPTR